MRLIQALCLAVCGAVPGAFGKVVINEILYNAPDDLDDLEYIELHNTAAEAADISNWTFTKGLQLQFPANTKIPAQGFAVVTRDFKRFAEYYKADAIATFSQKLSNDGEAIELRDASGKIVDSVSYKDRAPWPRGADGESGSLERIFAEGPSGDPSNWISSPLTPGRKIPGGTPGKKNSGAEESLPPAIANVSFAPQDVTPADAIYVQADVRGADRVELLYRLAGSGFERDEASIAMKPNGGTKFVAQIPAQPKNQLVRFRVRAIDTKGAERFYPAETEPRPALSAYVHEKMEPAKIPFAWIIDTSAEDIRIQQRGGAPRWDRGPRRGRSGQPTDPSHNSAFVYFDPANGKVQLFDFIQVTPRNGGRKVRLSSDQMLDGMTTVNLIFEYDDKFVLSEPLAYEVYRRAGMAAEQSFHVRLWINGQPQGYQLLVEQPNKAFLRRNKIKDDGNLYKMLWYKQGLIGQHEKKTNTRHGHDDLKLLYKELTSTTGREQWNAIKKHFDIPQVATYFAVNQVLDHWDGFFNNYFTYHDVSGTGKWTMFPWDQDKTWGIVDGSNGPFYQLPLTFGANGDRGPNGNRGGFHQWWRPPGWFSGPLLANPYFRRVFLARTKEIAQNIYTEEKFHPLIDELGAKLRDEVAIRAKIVGEDPREAARRLERNLKFLRDHVSKRRAFLMESDEIQQAKARAESEP